MSTKRKQNKPHRLLDNQKTELALSFKKKQNIDSNFEAEISNKNNIKNTQTSPIVPVDDHLLHHQNSFLDKKIDNKNMSNDQENFYNYYLNSSNNNSQSQMTNFDDFYKLFNLMKFFTQQNPLNLSSKNAEYSNLLSYFTFQQQQHQLHSNDMFLANLAPFLLAGQHTPETPTNTQSQEAKKYPHLNTTDLLKQSIDKIFSSSENLNKPNLKRKKSSDEMTCSCGLNFDSLDLLTVHLKQSNHRVSTNKRLATTPPIMSSNQPQNDVVINSSYSHKMVRGQEEWVNNSRNNNFISQILKCLECSASFETLSDLSLHMLKSNHFSKFHPNQSQTVLSSSPSSPSSSSSGNKKQNNALNSIVSNSFVKQKSAFSSCNTNKQLTKSAQSLNLQQQHQTVSDDFLKQNKATTNKNLSILNQQKFNCKICKKKFSNELTPGSTLPPLIELIQHLKNVHSITQICTNCGDYFENFKDLNDHLAEFHHNHSQQTARNLQDSAVQSTNTKCLNSNLKKQAKSVSQNQNLNSSISPSSQSSSSSSSHSNTSSPSSFLYENKDKTASNHPLLALQMFVNGNTQLTQSAFVSQAQNAGNGIKAPVISLSNKDELANTISKLPAKKRPYVRENENDKDEAHIAEPKSLLSSANSSPSSSPLANAQNHYQPLHLLQNMRMNLDEYFSR